MGSIEFSAATNKRDLLEAMNCIARLLDMHGNVITLQITFTEVSRVNQYLGDMRQTFGIMRIT